ncbi:MAG TPA: HAMP domain-containing sensor histidine kinase [Amycolatopsis sp.]|jgi:two-component system sensor histidine kinase BaeS|nr:HAMP domain-containing sensor histidine kinase [Amycolatopsis sp.]
MPSHGLRARLLAGTVVVAAGSVAATAWLSVQSTTTSIAQQQDLVRAAYAPVYGGLVDYAATHTNWSSVGPVLADLAQQSGVRIVLTPAGARPIESSAAAPGPAQAAEPSVPIDPLTVDNALAATRFPDDIDPRVAGPFLLTTQEHADLEELVERTADCLARSGVSAEIAEVDSGRPYLRVPQSRVPLPCETVVKAGGGLIGFEDSARVTPTATEQAALTRLAVAMEPCAGSDTPVRLALDSKGEVTVPVPSADPARLASCLLDARRQVLRPYVAPIAFLQITALGQDTRAGVGLSSAGALRITGVAALVAVLTIGVAMVLATRVIRPIRILTEATRRMRAGEHTARARTSARWEIAELTAAFNEMAEHVAGTDRQRKELVNDISHELRTPLGTIRGWLVAAHDGVADLDAELVSSLLEETLLLQHLIDDLRDLSLADAGQLRLEPVELNLGELLRHVAAAGGGRATVDAPPELFLVADPMRLRQAVGNLVANAERHTPPDGRIAVSARRNGSDVVIDVSDTGPGIPAADLPHVFDRFWRADKSRNRRTGGSGLGLAIVRQLVEAHGGVVRVTSTPGAGSTFTVRLPLTKKPS